MQNNQIPNDEIDFKKVANVFINLLVHPINSLLRYYKTTFVFILIAIIASIVVRFGFPQQYKSSFIIRPTIKNERLHIKMLEDLQLLWKLNDSQSLAKELKIDEKTVSCIDQILITNYAFSKNKADSSNMTGVELLANNNTQFYEIQNAILKYLEENPYIKKQKEIEKKVIELKSKLIEKDILLLDSLKELQLSNYGKLKMIEQNNFLVSEINNPVSTYSLSLERLNQKAGLIFQTEFINHFQLIKGVVPSQNHIWPPRLLILLCVSIPFFLLICLLYLYVKERKDESRKSI